MKESREIFLCYAHEDDALREQLEKHLRTLQRQGIITMWHDRKIDAGTEWEPEIARHLDSAQIILLLISPDFINSDYCYGIEMKRAMERHQRGETCVIPVILRPVFFRGAPFGKLQVLPTDAIPVSSSQWHNADEAFYNVAEGIYKVIQKSALLTPNVPDDELPLDPISPQYFPNTQLLSPTLQWSLRGHTDVILRIIWSRKGHILASTGNDKSIKLWNPQTGEHIRTLWGHSMGVNQVAWSLDDQTFASASHDGSIRVWDTTTGKTHCHFQAHDDDIPSLSWSPDGEILASCSSDATIKLWHTYTWQPLRTLKGHTGGVCYVAWSLDGKKLASCSQDGTICIWDSASSTLDRTLSGHTNRIMCVAWLPNTSFLASASLDQTVRIWDTESGQQMRMLTDHNHYVRSVSFSCDGRLLASNSPERPYSPNRSYTLDDPPEGKVRLWSTDTWEPLATLPEHVWWWMCPGLAFHPKVPDILATLGEYDNVIHIWKLNLAI